jgi:hypothetical protein
MVVLYFFFFPSLLCAVFDGVVRYVMTGATSDLTGMAGLRMGIIKSKLNGVQGSPLTAFLHLMALSVNELNRRLIWFPL